MFTLNVLGQNKIFVLDENQCIGWLVWVMKIILLISVVKQGNFLVNAKKLFIIIIINGCDMDL